jgi:hypothetical protein
MDLRKLIAKHDEALVSRALLVGMARLGVLAAGTPEALDLIQSVAETTDYRDELPARFGELLALGVIRTDARWTDPVDESLVRLYSGQTETSMAARALGAKGGSVRSEAKAAAARAAGHAPVKPGSKPRGRPTKKAGSPPA